MRRDGSAPAMQLPAVAAAAAADRPALRIEEVFEQHVDFVWRCARRLGVREADLDDTVQEVFVTVHRRLDDFEARSSMQTWLFGILLRVVQHYRRSKARQLTKMEALVELGEVSGNQGQTGPHEQLQRQQQAAILNRLLQELDEDKRVVFILVELEERSVPEVAAALNVNVNTVYSRLRAARLELEKAVARLRASERGARQP